MTRPQVVALIVVNALISLIVSLTVTLAFARYMAAPQTQPAATQAVAAAEAPSATDTPAAVAAESTPQPVATYVVQAGDSLSSIAYRHEVSLEALMKANDIDNANYITLGQTLVIPVGGVALAPTATPRAVPTVAPVLTPGTGAVPVAVESVTAADDAAGEYVTVLNRGSQGVALQGWTLEDGDGHVYTFPNLFLWRSGTVLVHTAAGTDSATDLYWGLTDPIWDKPTEKAVLRDAQGSVVSELQVDGATASG
ncbi:MAG: lamin tail domain-containing protein [Anaerolineae bacterium]